MSSHAVSTPATIGPFPNDAASPSLIDLFSPVSQSPAMATQETSNVDPSLWRAESAHRAKNLAQMLQSLGHVATRLPGGRYPDGIEQLTTSLAAAYASLGEEAPDTPVPCARLVRQVVSGLVSLFEPFPGAIELVLAVDPLSISAERRRALVLILSELIINSLKHAFPGNLGGRIVVSMSVAGQWAELTIQNSGIGLFGGESPNQGVHIIEDLCSALGATINRTSPEVGLRVQLNFRSAPT